MVAHRHWSQPLTDSAEKKTGKKSLFRMSSLPSLWPTALPNLSKKNLFLTAQHTINTILNLNPNPPKAGWIK
jgi:hypothetical protein